VTSAKTLGHQHIDWLTLHAGTAAAENALGGRIESFDFPGKINADDSVRDQLEDGIEQVVLARLPRFAQAQSAGLNKRIH
jgi:hypothetical protein